MGTFLQKNSLPEVTKLQDLQAEYTQKLREMGEVFRQEVLLPFCLEHKLTWDYGFLQKNGEALTEELALLAVPLNDVLRRSVMSDMASFGMYVPPVKLKDILDIDVTKPFDLAYLEIPDAQVQTWQGISSSNERVIKYAQRVLHEFGYEARILYDNRMLHLFWRQGS